MRGRSRNNNNGGGNKGPNPLTRSYESNGPDVKIRGTAQHIAEKYSQLARDCQTSGDPVAAENYYQHAEHYIRIIAAAQEALREQYGYQPRSDDDGDDDGFGNGDRQGYGDEMDPASQPQPFEPRNGEGERRPRFDRQDRPERQERPDRQDRPERQDRNDRPERNDRQDRPDNRPVERTDRPERRDRFPRDRGPRPEYARDEQPRAEFDRNDRPERSERADPAPRAERVERTDRVERPERAERAPRGRPPRARVEAEGADPVGLPAFLTNPVRTPILPGIDDAPAPLPKAVDAAEGEVRPRRRAVRRPRLAEGEAVAGGNVSDGSNEKTPAE